MKERYSPLDFFKFRYATFKKIVGSAKLSNRKIIAKRKRKMAKQYAVYHTEKGEISSGGIGNHIDRKEGAEWSYQHADPERIHLNENIIVTEHCSKKLSEAISDRISEGYNARNNAGELKAIRKDAVKYQTHIMSGSPEQMKKIEDNPELRKQWINSNLDFLKKEYGEKTLFVLQFIEMKNNAYSRCNRTNYSRRTAFCKRNYGKP